MISEKLIFIVGNSRSGTTMLGRVLGNHPQVHTFGELHFFEQWVDAATVRERTAWSLGRREALLERLLTTAREGLFHKVTPGRYDADIEHVLAAAGANDPVSVYAAFLGFEARRHGKQVPCEQTPRYLFYTGEILQAFPGARIVNMVRDPRDVMLSQKNKWRRRSFGARNIPRREVLRAWVNYHPYTIARLWTAAVRAGRRFEGHPRFMTMQFEELLSHPDAAVRSLCSFVGISYEPNMLDVPQVGSSAGRDRPERKGINAERSGSWRNGGLTAVELAVCEAVSAEDMRVLGYAPAARPVPFVRRAASMALFGVKAIMALLMNLGRAKNLRETLRRRLRGGEEHRDRPA